MRDEEINGLQNYQIISQILDYELSKLLPGIVGIAFSYSCRLSYGRFNGNDKNIVCSEKNSA